MILELITTCSSVVPSNRKQCRRTNTQSPLLGRGRAAAAKLNPDPFDRLCL